MQCIEVFITVLFNMPSDMFKPAIMFALHKMQLPISLKDCILRG